ncbi:MAG: transaldolase [Pseudoalteromonas tetraodonis]|jgi:transaldolase|uniref:transaldolase n=1 Tax=Pseudoalteromonas TaxID=53246 RepID=UPI00110B4046|nr:MULTISPECIES: transaldolase [Pseudoalteromonas]MBT2151354.1 transaldolase [Pseudoalteromonas tetraodonis]MCK8102771.1 transaldolase [Pseudoalteromonas sp. 2CM36K]MCK8137662.1 transaldolase [Pseudoalteromonas sp. 2CM28B]MDX1361519.1 transaldolase [Pseudoalteromonas tetraodonis]TMO25985.1 transaldolase [Pseudoalteromonas sp. S4741]
MTSALQRLKQHSSIVADTGDIEAIKKYQPEDATTNPSLLLKASEIEAYKPYLDKAWQYAKETEQQPAKQLELACDYFAVLLGKEISEIVPGYISTEVDARLSFDTQATINKAHTLLSLYEKEGVSKDKILIKIASTWEGIKAAEQLEKEGTKCNLTLLFSDAQARACADANVFLISPFVGRILDWHVANGMEKPTDPLQDPGVQSVRSIFEFYKRHDYKTVVMGASFRNTGEIIALTGCDKLTISPNLLEDLGNLEGAEEYLLASDIAKEPKPEPLSETQFRWLHNQDAMATEKLAEGIRSFADAQEQLEARFKAM